MAERAFVAHTLPGRLRLRIPARSRDPVYFATLVQKLAAHPDVDELKVNPTTGSLLIVHSGDEERLRRFAKERRLFSVEERAPLDLKNKAADERTMSMLGYHMTPAQGEALLLSTIAALLGLSAYQARRGKFLPAGMTMLSNAVQLFAFLRQTSLERQT